MFVAAIEIELPGAVVPVTWTWPVATLDASAGRGDVRTVAPAGARHTGQRCSPGRSSTRLATMSFNNRRRCQRPRSAARPSRRWPLRNRWTRPSDRAERRRRKIGAPPAPGPGRPERRLPPRAGSPGSRAILAGQVVLLGSSASSGHRWPVPLPDGAQGARPAAPSPHRRRGNGASHRHRRRRLDGGVDHRAATRPPLVIRRLRPSRTSSRNPASMTIAGQVSARRCRSRTRWRRSDRRSWTVE